MQQLDDEPSLIYYIRVLSQNLRMGLAQKSILNALVESFLPEKATKQQIA